MDVQKAKESVISAGKMLVEAQLVARTWGNVSCRIDERRFAITPSGMAYETLRPEDIVVVNINSLTYEGSIKPSSEKGIHAGVYKQKPEVNFVIHTHQTNASVAGIMGGEIDIKGEDTKRLIGSRIPLADYGLPGTKKLQKNVMTALNKSDSCAVLMRNHGALCFGENPQITFQIAKALEVECERFLTEPFANPSRNLGHSYRQNGNFIYWEDGEKAIIDISTGTSQNGSASAMVLLHTVIYRTYPDINVIHGSTLPYTVSASERYSVVKPLLDDFAQIIGVSARSAEWDESNVGNSRVVKALKGRNAVLIKGLGALCCASSEDDAIAVEMLMEKGCMASLSAEAHHKIHPIASMECLLMREVYKLKYSKKKK